jgi:hypothetical protein
LISRKNYRGDGGDLDHLNGSDDKLVFEENLIEKVRLDNMSAAKSGAKPS